MYYATRDNMKDLIRDLKDNGANNLKNIIDVENVIKNGNEEKLFELLSDDLGVNSTYDRPYNRTPLIFAAIHGNSN